MFFSSAVCANHPEAWVPSQVQGNGIVPLGFMPESISYFSPYTMGSADKQDFKIQNMVGSCDVKFPIRLEGLAYSHGAFSNVSCLPNMHYLKLWIFVALS
jgi:hypothetical protein